MSTRIQSAIAPIVVMCVAGSAAHAVHGSGGRPLQIDRKALIMQPSNWVPVYLEIEVRSPVGPVHLVRKYRAADGSLRVEYVGGPSNVGIESVRAGKHFREQNGRWFSHPLRLLGERQPTGMLRRSQVKQVDAADPRVVHLDATNLNLTFWELPKGAIVSPELNMAVVYDELEDGSVYVVAKIDLTPPTAELFDLPKNVVAEERQAPEGEDRITILPGSGSQRLVQVGDPPDPHAASEPSPSPCAADQRRASPPQRRIH